MRFILDLDISEHTTINHIKNAIGASFYNWSQTHIENEGIPAGASSRVESPLVNGRWHVGEEEAERLKPATYRESTVDEFMEIGAAILRAAADHVKHDAQAQRGLLDLASDLTGEPYTCADCGRPEAVCSAAPCPAVVEDRAELV